MEDNVAGPAALLLVAGLIDALERVAPGTNLHIDRYLIGATERRDIDNRAIEAARQVLAGLREGL